MVKSYRGKLVSMGALGVGTVNVAGLEDYVYFNPRQVRGYRGETVHELANSARFRLKPGAEVRVELTLDGQVRSVVATEVENTAAA